MATISTTTLYLQFSGTGLEWLKVFPVKLTVWLIWGLYSPVVFYLAGKFRIEKGAYLKGLSFHVPFSLFSIFFNVFIYALILYLFPQTSNINSFQNTFTGLSIFLFEWYFFIYWSIVMIRYALDYFSKFKDSEIETVRLENQLVEAQLQALKMQLHPHFLFNTLNTIAASTRQDAKQSAIDMLVGLGDLLRLALSQKDIQQVPLEVEVAFIEKYLEIEKKRFRKNLKIEITYDDQAKRAEIPNFLLQPIVENAIYHGISKQKAARKLTIAVTKSEENLILTTYNEGPFLPSDFDLETQQGIGLTNTINRLQQLYNGQASMSMENFESGVKVTVRLPYQLRER
ncbi:MAG: histidine kinase [Cyclobacteriaceae bacterium]|nr:histidine kinase [Cyclobacteriaceae bacterium HetDA_MAG_MS6]